MNGREKFKLSAILSTRLQGVCPKVGMGQNKDYAEVQTHYL